MSKIKESIEDQQDKRSLFKMNKIKESIEDEQDKGLY